MRKNIFLCCLLCFLVIAACNPYAHPESNSSKNEGNDPVEEIAVQFEPISFEEAIAGSTQVFLGKVISKHDDAENSFVVMAVEKAFYGIEEGAEVKISLDARVSDLRMYLEVGEDEELLVMLQKYVSVLQEDQYVPSYYCFIPMTHLEDARLAAGMLSSMSSVTERDQLLKACEKYAGSEEKMYYGKEYIRSSQLQTIVGGSENIIGVRICSELLTGSASDRRTVLCEVTKSLKGDLETGKVFSITLLNEWGLKIGEEYILAVEFYENADILGDYYGLTSKASFWGLDREQEITEWIQ